MLRWLMRLVGLASPHPDACGFCQTKDPDHKFEAGRWCSICPDCAVGALSDFPGRGGWNLTIPPGAKCGFCGERGNRHLFLSGPGASQARICGKCLLSVVSAPGLGKPIDNAALDRLKRMP